MDLNAMLSRGGTLLLKPRAGGQPRLATAMRQECSRVVVAAAEPALGNVVPGWSQGPRDAAAVSSGVSTRRLELEREARRRLQEADSWHQGPTPPNMCAAASPHHLKDLILGTPQGRLVVVDYFSPSCAGCRTLWPKLKQVAAQNPDVAFVTVNAANSYLGEMARNLGAAKLPWFQLYQGGGGGEMLSSFTANLSTVSVLRAEISTYKASTSMPSCP